MIYRIFVQKWVTIFSNPYNQPAITNLYYPGYSDKHKYSHVSFINDFDDFCSTEIIGYENAIMGDFNIHMENHEDSVTKRMKEVIAGNDLYIVLILHLRTAKVEKLIF